MTLNHRPISLLTSLALGIGATLFVLFAGGRPAAAAPAQSGANLVLPANCNARNDRNTLLVFSSPDSAAVRQAVLAALPNDTVRLAGTCAGVAAGGGTSQTVLINKVLTLVGGYTTTNWVTSFPLTQPTTLDAQGLGRVITASADITIAELTAQNGNSFGGNGGGIFAGGRLAMLGVVNLLSNTAQVGTSVNGPMAPDLPSGGFGGGANASSVYMDCHDAFVAINEQCQKKAIMQSNRAVSGGGLFGQNLTLQFVTLDSNLAAPYGYGGGVDAVVSLRFYTGTVSYNSAGFGGGIAGTGSMDIVNSLFLTNSAVVNGGGGWSYNNPVIWKYDVVDFNTAPTASAWQFYANNATLDSNRVENNISSGPAGSTLAFTDGTANVANTVVAGNRTNGGPELDWGTASEVGGKDILRALHIYGPGLSDAGRAIPVGSSVVNTATAVSVSGVTLFITDTIIGGYGTDLETRTAPSSTIVGDYNLFDQTPVISGTNIATGTHSLVGNPLFADALGHLSPGSPAIDHGIDVGLTVDFDGNHRPSGAGFDIGAYEFQVALLKLFLPLVRR